MRGDDVRTRVDVKQFADANKKLNMSDKKNWFVVNTISLMKYLQ